MMLSTSKPWPGQLSSLHVSVKEISWALAVILAKHTGGIAKTVHSNMVHRQFAWQKNYEMLVFINETLKLIKKTFTSCRKKNCVQSMNDPSLNIFTNTCLQIWNTAAVGPIKNDALKCICQKPLFQVTVLSSPSAWFLQNVAIPFCYWFCIKTEISFACD